MFNPEAEGCKGDVSRRDAETQRAERQKGGKAEGKPGTRNLKL